MSADCRWTRARLIAYADGELSEPDSAELQRHLASCSDCRVAADIEAALSARLRTLAATERAPERLAGRIRAGLTEIEREIATQPDPELTASSGGVRAEPAASPAPEPVEAAVAVAEAETPAGRRAASVKVSRRARGWGLTLAAAAAMILIVAGGLLWPSSGRGLLQAMADEHYEHSQSSDPQMKLDRVSVDSAELERYLGEHLQVEVKLPAQPFPQARGAACCRRGSKEMGLVACFCARRAHAVSLFIVRSADAKLDGLEEVCLDGRTFWRGSAGSCRAVIWKRSELLYALVGEFKAPADHLDLAARAARTIDARY